MMASVHINTNIQNIIYLILTWYLATCCVPKNCNVVPVLVVRVEVDAEKSQDRGRGEAAVMRTRSEGPLQPSLRPT